MPCSGGACVLIPTACPWPSASCTGSPCGPQPPPAIPGFFLGTDSAPHGRAAKESACGCAGIFNAPHALESYAQVFEQEGALERLENFASVYGPRFYGLPLNDDSIELLRQPLDVPLQLELGGEGEEPQLLVPFQAGETLPWRIAGSPRQEARRGLAGGEGTSPRTLAR